MPETVTAWMPAFLVANVAVVPALLMATLSPLAAPFKVSPAAFKVAFVVVSYIFPLAVAPEIVSAAGVTAMVVPL